MQITLPVSGKKLILKSWSMAKANEFYDAEMDMLDMEPSARVAALRALRDKKLFDLVVLYDGLPLLDDMPSRDVLLLLSLTEKYSANVPLNEIKNLLAGGDGTGMTSAAGTATTAGA